MELHAGLRAYTQIERPAPELLAAFRGLPASNIGDQMGRLYCMDSGISPLNASPLLGPAFTVKVAPGDNLLLHYALELAQPGDILVVDGGGERSRALIGEVMAIYARQRKLGGVVVNGCVRDSAALSQLTDFPVYALGVTPQGPYKNGPGEINVPVCCGGVAVLPGDILVGDADGVVVIRKEDAPQVAQAAQKRFDHEQEMFRTGKIDRDWAQGAFEKIPLL